MIRFSLGIPITIRPGFWLLAALIGFLNSFNLIGTLIWIVVIFISVLFHEFGHALTAKLFKRKPRIELVMTGGLTYHDGENLSKGKQFLIVLNGPIFGFILFGIATFLLRYPFFQSGIVGSGVKIMQIINLFWTVINLIPIIPLDGGQLLRILFQAIFKEKGVAYSYIASIVIAIIGAIIAFVFGLFLIGAIFFLLAFQCFDGYRSAREYTKMDDSQALKELLAEAELKLEEGQRSEALFLFERVRSEAKEGMIFVIASQYLAFLYYEKEMWSQVYEVLLPIRKKISPDALCLLHEAAFEKGDYRLVIELSAECFKILKNVPVAVRSACAYAALGEVKHAIGYLQAAHKEGLENLNEVVKEPYFDKIRDDPSFISFIKENQ